MSIPETCWQRVSLAPLQILLSLRKMTHCYQFPSTEAAESCTMEFKCLTLLRIHARATIIPHNKTGVSVVVVLFCFVLSFSGLNLPSQHLQRKC